MIYEPLNRGWLRILYLKGANFEASITCTLEHVLFESTNPPAYDTISYSWGDDRSTTEIFVDGERLKIPRNAAEALRWLRPLDSSTRTLWIDSVCIDQHNIDERNHQVAMMADIYRHACKNLIWLGEDDGTIKSAISNIDILTSDIMTQTNDLATFPLGPGPNHHLHQSSGIFAKFDAESIVRLLSRPWFSRLWVVQEATLAKTNLCHCGSFTFDLVPLLRVAKWLWTKRSHVRLHGDDNFREIRQVFAPAISLYDVVDEDLGWFHVAFKKGWFDEKDHTAAFFSILDMTTVFHATQLVDHVFGILGLWLRFSPLHTTIPALLQPDYRKSVSDVFRDATRHAMIESESLALWQNLHHRPKEELVLPSWVRRWDRNFDPLFDPTPFHRGVFASGEWLNDMFDSAPGIPESVVLDGLFIDSAQECQVEVVSRAYSDPSFGPKFVDEVEALINHHPRAREMNDIDLALRTILVAAENAERDVATEEDLKGLDDLREHFWSKGMTAPSLVQLSSDPEYVSASAGVRRAGRYGEAAWRMCFLRRFLITAGGRIGLGPQTIQSGDITAIIYGCEWPVVLRQADRTGVYQMIGTAWIYGVMKGEAVTKHMDTRGEDDDEVFTII